MGGDSARPRVEKTPQSSPRVTDSLAKDPDFIKAGCHIGRYTPAAVNTEAERADIQALRSDLDSTSLHINVSFLLLFKIIACLPNLTPFLVQKIIEYSQSKDKFLRASLMRISESQNFEDELERVRAMNEMLLTQNEELVAQLDVERREKTGT
jgi:hypothetical protein